MPRQRLTPRQRRWLTLFIVLAAVGGAAFALAPLWFYPQTILRFQHPAPKVSVNDQPTLLAGIAERDITPPTGLPRFGYATLAHDATMAGTPLKTRAFYLKPAQGEPFVLVQADLGASSLLLQHGIAERVAQHSDIAVRNITVNVTHTHSAPGNYLDTDFYNAFGSNRPGFDPAVYEFLVTRMSDAVIAAYNNRRPAKIAIGQREVYGLTRNRSIHAYVQNKNVSDKSESDQHAFKAVNPELTLLRIDQRGDDGQYHPAGAFSFFSIHGTTIPAAYDGYHADAWYRMETVLQERVQAAYKTPWPVIHGPAEATHADNTPDWQDGERGPAAAERIGRSLGENAFALFQSLDNALTDKLSAVSALRVIDLYAQDEKQRGELCRRPIMGAAIAGAAKGDEHVLTYIPPFAPGWPRSFFTDGCQGEKQWLLSQLQPLIFPPAAMPHRMPIHIARLNELLLISLPFEVDLEAGNRIRSSVQNILADKNLRVVIASHANSYMGYVTTPEEYGVQFYEGGHTIYGKYTQPYLSRVVANSVKRLMTSGAYQELPKESVFALRSRSYMK